MFIKIKKILILALSLLSCLSSAYAITPVSATSTVPPARVLAIQHWQTTQGVPVYFVPAVQLPMLDIQVVFNAGSARDGKKFGLAQLTNGLLNEGAGQLTADQIAQQFDAVGAIFNASVDRDMSTVGLRSMSDPNYLQPALQTFLNVLSAPDFNDGDFNRVKTQLLANLQAEMQSPTGVAKKAFFNGLYGTHPYAHSPLGTTPTVTALTRQDVQQFYRQYYVAKNALIAIVGNTDKASAQELAERIAQSLPIGEAPTAIASAQNNNVATTLTINFPSQQTAILLGQIATAPNDADEFALKVGNYILGGGSLVSQLFTQVRAQQGFTYGITSRFFPLAARGPFLVFLQTRNEKAQDAVKLTQQVMENFVRNGPSAQELTAAKDNLIGEFPLNVASNADIMGYLVQIGFYHLPLNYLDTYRSTIQAVTLQQIQTAFQKHIQLDKFLTVTVGPVMPVSPVIPVAPTPTLASPGAPRQAT